MKPKLTLLLMGFWLLSAMHLYAQKLNNIYEDALAIKSYSTYADGKFTITDTANWDLIIKKYIPVNKQTSPAAILAYMQQNPIIVNSNLIPDETEHAAAAKYDFNANLVASLNTAPSNVATTSAPFSFSTPAIADQLTQLIIERAKEELTATFFQNFKTELQKNPILSTAFPKTLSFIGQIEPYLYASYLTTLRQAFFTDVNNLPFEVGAILRTAPMKKFMAANPSANNVWIAVPLLQFVGDMHQGKSLADAIRALYPDPELLPVSPAYYNILKISVILSESIRDKTNAQNWVNSKKLDTLFANPVEGPFFFALLFESTKQAVMSNDGTSTFINKYITNANITKIKALLKTFTDGYNNANDLATAYAAVAKDAKTGDALTLADVIKLIDATRTNLSATFTDINALLNLSDQTVGSVTGYFNDLQDLTMILKSIDQKQYASAMMTTTLLMNKYIVNDKINWQPFKDVAIFSPLTSSANAQSTVTAAMNYLSRYDVANPDKQIEALLTDLKTANAALAGTPTKVQIDSANKILAKIVAYSDSPKKKDGKNTNGSENLQKVLKYATLMASLAEAQTSADVQAALNSAIMPVGSSSQKYYTACSVTINSYIGGAYYYANYAYFNNPGSMKIKTLGVGLPIGVNVSVSTRSPVVGAVSLFASVIDLGAVASYRLNNPPDSKTQTLPAFTLQNLLAPGGFLVFNRIAKSPLALGFGIQRAPQLNSITNGNADLTTDPKWRIGAFLSVDIPLFNLYSRSLKRPIKD